MKKLLFGLALLPCIANAQFVPGQVLTAAELNTQFALYAPLAGATFTGGISASGITGTPISGSTGSFTNLTASGTVTLPAGSVPLTGLSAQAANTVVANVTAGSATPTAVALPSCSTSASALNYTSASGFTCNTAVNASQLGGATFASPGPIGSSTPGTGNFTTLSTSGLYHATNTAAGSAIIELTGNGGVTPNKYLGVLGGIFTIYSSNAATQLFSIDDSGNQIALGSITPSQTGGIIGTNTTNNANAGSVGEYLTTTTTGTSIVSVTVTNSVSENITAGDWDVECITQFVPAAGVTTTFIGTGVSNVSATFANFQNNQILNGISAAAVNGAITLASPVSRVSIASTTPYYCVAQAIFSGGTQTVSGYIRARRVR